MEMNDIELLELAAKAYGVTGQYVNNYGSGNYYYQGNGEGILWEYPDGGQTVWNPLDDDGDALRLAVKLGLAIRPGSQAGGGWSFAESLYNHKFRANEYAGGDMYAATRRAIVRAAAEIGSKIP